MVGMSSTDIMQQPTAKNKVRKKNKRIEINSVSVVNSIQLFAPWYDNMKFKQK